MSVGLISSDGDEIRLQTCRLEQVSSDHIEHLAGSGFGWAFPARGRKPIVVGSLLGCLAGGVRITRFVVVNDWYGLPVDVLAVEYAPPDPPPQF